MPHEAREITRADIIPVAEYAKQRPNGGALCCR